MTGITFNSGKVHKIAFSEAEQFFYEHAGYSCNPDEPAWSGRARCAIHLAEAEARMHRIGAEVQWELDPDADNEPGEGYFVSGYPQWSAVLMPRDGGIFDVLASLSGIDFGKPYDEVDIKHEPYARVVAAQLAAEATGLLGA